MKYITAGFVLIMLLSSCGSSAKKKLNTEVTTLEQEVEKGFTKDKATKLVDKYEKFIKDFPNDTNCKSYMVNGAEMSLLQQDANGALKFINEFLGKYPDDPRAGLMQYKKALVYDLLMHDGLRAVAEYDIFIRTYPKHPLRQDAENGILLIQDPAAFLDRAQHPNDSTRNSPQNQ